MYGKNTLDKIYLTQKKLLPHPSTSQRGKTLIPRQSFCSPKGETLHPFKGKLLYPLKLKGELQFAPTDPCSLPPAPDSLIPTPWSLLPAPCSLSLFPALWPPLPTPCSPLPVLCSLFPVLCSLFSVLCPPVHCFMLKISCNTKKIVPLHQITFMGVDWFWQQA